MSSEEHHLLKVFNESVKRKSFLHSAFTSITLSNDCCCVYAAQFKISQFLFGEIKMFSDDLSSSFFPTNLISNSLLSDPNISQSLASHERAFRQMHQEFRATAREIFDAAIHPRQLYSSHYR